MIKQLNSFIIPPSFHNTYLHSNNNNRNCKTSIMMRKNNDNDNDNKNNKKKFFIIIIFLEIARNYLIYFNSFSISIQYGLNNFLFSIIINPKSLNSSLYLSKLL